MSYAPGVAAPRSASATTGRRLLAWSVAAYAFASVGCPGSPAMRPDVAPQASTPEPFDVGEWIYDAGLRRGWEDSGSAPRELVPNSPAKIRFGDASDWVLDPARPERTLRRAGVPRARTSGRGEFLEVRLGSSGGRVFPGVKLKPDHCTDIGDGWAQVRIPIAELNPDTDASFDRLIFRPFRPFSKESVLFDRIGLAKTPAALPVGAQAAAYSRPIRARVSCDGKETPISPLIYGVAFGNKGWDTLRPTARRWGGSDDPVKAKPFLQRYE